MAVLGGKGVLNEMFSDREGDCLVSAGLREHLKCRKEEKRANRSVVIRVRLLL